MIYQPSHRSTEQSSEQPISILLVEDNPTDAELTIRALVAAELAIEFNCLRTEQQL